MIILGVNKEIIGSIKEVSQNTVLINASDIIFG